MTLMRPDQGQAATEPASTPWQSVASSIQPASSTTLRLSCVIGIGVEQDRGDLVTTRSGERCRAGTVAGSGSAQSAIGCLAGRLAELAGVLPDVDRLRAERDPVERRLVTVLTRNRHLARQALRLERGDDAAGHAVVLREHCVDSLFSAVRNCSICVWAMAGSQLSV